MIYNLPINDENEYPAPAHSEYTENYLQNENNNKYKYSKFSLPKIPIPNLSKLEKVKSNDLVFGNYYYFKDGTQSLTTRPAYLYLGSFKGSTPIPGTGSVLVHFDAFKLNPFSKTNVGIQPVQVVGNLGEFWKAPDSGKVGGRRSRKTKTARRRRNKHTRRGRK